MVSSPYAAFSRAVRLTNKAGKKLNLPARPASSTKFMRGACELVPNLINPLTTTAEPMLKSGVNCVQFTYGDLSESKHKIIYLPGGAYIMGNSQMSSSMCAKLSEMTKIPVVGVNYRHAPEYPLPCCTEDVVSLYKNMIENTDPSKISIAGDSAGGGLCLLALQALRDQGVPLPKCAVSISPFADLTGSGDSHITNAENDVMLGDNGDLLRIVIDMAIGNVDINNNKIADNDPSLPMYSPANGSFEKFPPLYVLVGDTEILLSDAEKVAANAAAAGVDVTLEVVPDMCHSYPIFTPLFPEAAEGVAKVANFIKKHCAA